MSKPELLNIENTIKLGTLICTACTLYFAIKSDLRDLSTQKHYEVEHLQYQITELRDCCDKKQSNNRQTFALRNEAILPNNIELLDDK